MGTGRVLAWWLLLGLCGVGGEPPSLWPDCVLPYKLDKYDMCRNSSLKAFDILKEKVPGFTFRPAQDSDTSFLSFQGMLGFNYFLEPNLPGRQPGETSLFFPHQQCDADAMVSFLTRVLGLVGEHASGQTVPSTWMCPIQV
eukprot:Sspe_Gene.78212::Locus_48917_Transcript_4_6_Confidence_0.600_Length_568::g.78212::m.78212